MTKIDNYETKSQPITKTMVWKAYLKVKANKGSGGIDKMTWKELDNNQTRYLYKLWNRLASGSYFPMDVKQVEIKKDDGGIRKLGIPTLLDRIAQQVVKEHIEPRLEKEFHENSFGYRPNRSCHQAIAKANVNCSSHRWAIDLDIKGFFDNLNHDLLMKAVTHYCNEKWVLLYINRWLKAGIVQKDGQRIAREDGTPQGGVISPLLANIYLHVVFDKWMQKNHPEKPFERYADDVIVHCVTEKQANYVLKDIRKRMETCKLTLHPVKTKIVNLSADKQGKYPVKFDFLGFTFKPIWAKTKKGFYLRTAPMMSMKAKKKATAKLRKLQIHKMRRKIEEVATELNPILRGLMNYYCKFMPQKTHLFWYSVNQRLIKWVRWQKKCNLSEAIKYLRTKWKEQRNLFAHWKLVHP